MYDNLTKEIIEEPHVNRSLGNVPNIAVSNSNIHSPARKRSPSKLRSKCQNFIFVIIVTVVKNSHNLLLF